MSQYKLVTYQSPQGPRAGLVDVDDTVFDLAARQAAPPTRPCSTCCATGTLRARPLQEAAASTQTDRLEGHPLERTKLLAPVPCAGGIFCAGANFTDHMMEMAKVQNIAPEPDPHTLGLNPWHFIKARALLAPPDATVKLPPYSKMVDWEAELIAVIGRPARDVLDRDARSTTSPAIPSPTISRRATSPSGRTCPTPRRSNTTGSARNASTAPARSDPGSCRRRQ